jgi:hypothetical protein
MRKHILFKVFAQATGANRNMISAPIFITLHTSYDTMPRLSVFHEITEMCANTANHTIIEIRGPIAGLMKNRT